MPDPAPPPVPFNRPTRVAGDAAAVADALAGGHLAGDGPASRAATDLLGERLGVEHVLLTPSGTAALELAALAIGLGPGDEVIVPSFAFPTTASAMAARGARIVFAEVDEATLGVDVDHVASLVGPRTRAIVPVHYGGVAGRLDELVALADAHDVTVLEDAAQSLFGRWQGRALGSIGACGAFSFHETKNVTCGEGGALAVRDPAVAARAEVLREKGTDRAQFLRGEVDRYTWVGLGSSYLLAEPLAALLLAQLRAADAVQAARRAVWERYRDGLADWAAEVGATIPVAPHGAEPAWHCWWLLVPQPEDRDRLLAHLREQGIAATFHFQPLHRSRQGRALVGEAVELPVTDSVAERLVRLPFFTDLSPSEQGRVVEAVRSAPLD